MSLSDKARPRRPRFKADLQLLVAPTQLPDHPLDRRRPVLYLVKGVSGPAHESSPDYWIASILGFIELIVFPVLMTANAGTAIGAWIGFKAIAQWDTWKTSRNTFNLFLIGNALVLIAAWISARFF